MNDRFKFRFYDNNKKIMIDENTNNKILENEYGEDEWYWCIEAFMPTIFDYFDPVDYDKKDFVIMQCTGLKDKNGKLIYEGDIVKYKDEVYDLCIGKIEWDNAHYELQYYTGEKYGWFSHILCFKHIKNIEVIGNIYENKELLESEG